MRSHLLAEHHAVDAYLPHGIGVTFLALLYLKGKIVKAILRHFKFPCNFLSCFLPGVLADGIVQNRTGICRRHVCICRVVGGKKRDVIFQITFLCFIFRIISAAVRSARRLPALQPLHVSRHFIRMSKAQRFQRHAFFFQHKGNCVMSF